MKDEDKTKKQLIDDLIELRREREQPSGRHLLHLSFLKNLERINRVILRATDLKEMLESVLNEMIEIFDSDRAWLLYPCDPDAKLHRVPMECTKPEYPGAFALNEDLPVTSSHRHDFQLALESTDPITFGPGNDRSFQDNAPASTQFSVKSRISIAIHPKTGTPWLFGMHQCSRNRVWTAEERRLFKEIGHRVADALSSLLLLQELRESEERYRLLFETMVSGFSLLEMVYDEDGKPIDCRYLAVNPAHVNHTGLRAEDIIGKRAKELFDLKDEWIERYDRVNKTGEPVEIEDYAEGLDRWFRVIAYRPKPGLVAVTFQNITERKQAEEALWESEERYRVLFESTLDAILVTDPDGRILSANPACMTMLGYESLEELFNTNMSDLYLNPEQREAVLAELMERGYLEDYEMILIKKDGTPVHILVSLVARRDEEGSVLQMEGFFKDITERTLAKEALSAERERLAVTLRSIGDGVITTDDSGKIILVNGVAEILTGWTEEESIGKSLSEVFHIISEETRERCENPAEKVLETGTIVGLANSTVLIARDGTERIIADSGAPIRIGNNTVVGVVVVFRDVTEERRIEQELQKIEKLESIGVLAGGIAHDLNNFLTGVIGNISLARMYENPAEKDGRLAEAEKASMRIRDLTQQLLTFSKGGAPILQPANIADLLRDSATFTLRGSNVRCSFSLPDDLWAVEIDEGQINQVINNLIINAKQAMPNGGMIEIRAENTHINEASSLPLKAGAYIRVSVDDEGIGISAEHIRRIFDPFYTTKQEGSGLGLATSYSIIEKHNGHISVESQIEIGTTFHIYLPAFPEEAVEAQEQIAGRHIMGEGRILVMDDEKMIRELAANMLNSLGYSVTTAADGAEAIETYKEAMESGTPFDAVILDLTIPGGMGGKETIQRLLKIDPEVKAIVSSGYSNDPVLADFGEYGFKAAMAKPYKIRELSMILHGMIPPMNRGDNEQ